MCSTLSGALKNALKVGHQGQADKAVSAGCLLLEQETNAYAVLPASQWRGHKEPPDPPAPQSGTWGDHPPLPSQIEQAVTEQRESGGIRSVLQILEADVCDPLAAALARLGRTLQSGNPQ